MQVTSELLPMFSYSLIPIIILIILLVILFFIIIHKPKKKVTTPINVVIPPRKNLFDIKNRYLTHVNDLLKDVNNNKISNREAYQKLSIYIRNFIYETTNIRVQNYTLSEIKKVNIPILYELVSEYYDPEFSSESGGNIVSSIEKTRMVIARWC